MADINIINQVPNTTVSHTYANRKANITITGNTDGILSDIVAHFYDEYGDSDTANFIISGNTATVSFETDPNQDVTITGTFTPVAKDDVTIKNEIANTTVTHTYENGKVNITLTGNNGGKQFRLLDVVAVYYDEYGGENKYNFDIQNTDTANTATVSFDVEKNTEITITGQFVRIINVVKQLDNCTGNVPDYFLQSEKINITLTANEGKVFKETPILRYIDNFGGENDNKFTVSTDMKTATLDLQLPTSYTITDDITIIALAVSETPLATNYGAINVYLTTLDEINQFAQIRFGKIEGSYYVVFQDYGEYINRIKRIYTNIPVGGDDVMLFGNLNTSIKTHIPKDTVITLDFGNVVIPTPNNDIVDYESEILMFIPFVGNVSLSSEYMGETINLQIVIDVITGNGLYKVFHNDVVILTGECNPSNDILYRTYTDDLSAIGGDWNENVFMGLEPYLYVKYFQSKNTVGRNSDFKRGLISSYTGFNVFDDITPITTPEMLANEQETIYNALQTGVYIE